METVVAHEAMCVVTCGCDPCDTSHTAALSPLGGGSVKALPEEAAKVGHIITVIHCQAYHSIITIGRPLDRHRLIHPIWFVQEGEEASSLLAVEFRVSHDAKPPRALAISAQDR